MKEAIATVGSNALVLDTNEEKNLGTQATALERQVSAMEVTSEIGYKAAGELLKKVKKVQKSVKDYWEPLRKSAKAAYDNVVAKKKAMLDPIDNAESILKRKMSDFAIEQERIRREEERRQQEEARAETEWLLQEAIAAEESGDAASAESAMAVAEVYDDFASITPSSQPQKPKMDGVSLSKTWKITSIDTGKVPVFFNGAELRPVDTSAVMRLIKASKGQIVIPGVVYTEDYTVSAKA